MGLIYICYQEDARENIADDRTQYFIAEIQKWAHQANLSILHSKASSKTIARRFPRSYRDWTSVLERSIWRLFLPPFLLLYSQRTEYLLLLMRLRLLLVHFPILDEDLGQVL
jgi:hypothetical protein